ncbi:hypothetical protein [Longimicrobium sp.]|uniref:hypothetical protein n=1 Tax=Longimicrobium sp. TaxID=2029185 RepID=UPI002CC0ABAE|nr:hypothetical protein [Longimicrobium sp.]HSU18085.1 hypothetical protein [Longimicrobium sp.]
MNRSMLSRATFSAVVVLALGFGVREAFASPPPKSSAAVRTPYCYYNWECQNYCDAAYGPGTTVGICDSGCHCYR